MQESTQGLATLVSRLSQMARAAGLTDTQWATRAGVRKETLSRLRHRSTCDLATLNALAEAVNARLDLVATTGSTTSADGHFPAGIDRDYERQLVDLCASRSLAPDRWTQLGPRFFMAGLAVMLASVAGYDRRGLLALAEQLHPGSSEPAVFTRWLDRSPLRPSRFLPQLNAEGRHAA
jgi:DNA-binding phage protein